MGDERDSVLRRSLRSISVLGKRSTPAPDRPGGRPLPGDSASAARSHPGAAATAVARRRRTTPTRALRAGASVPAATVARQGVGHVVRRTGIVGVTLSAATVGVLAAGTVQGIPRDTRPATTVMIDAAPVSAQLPVGRAENVNPQVRALAAPGGSPQAIAKAMLVRRGWSGQWTCLNSLWKKESGWRYRATNRYTQAYGIPQAMPGRKMASAGKDWRTNPATQIRWGLSYIAARYHTPCRAWAHSRATGWY
jgi:hypothetical protein